MDRPVRLQKFLADAGVASRRASEEIILAGRVTVDGQTVTALGTKVQPGQNRVSVDGQVVKARRRLYLALHKPRGYLCTRSDPQRRRTVGELLPREWQNVYPVGRLDADSEGLLFLSNDGEFALKLTHPRYGTRKTYRVFIEGRVAASAAARMVKGLMDEGELLQARKASVLSSNQTQSVLELELVEGKKREIRRMCAAIGLSVLRLQRVQIGPIKLGELPPGKWRTLTETEIKSLLQSHEH